MQRYFLNSITQEISGPDAHHIIKVMRMSSGDEVVVCFNGHCFLVVLHIENGHVYYETKEELKHELSPEITLFQGLPKHPKTETIAKYATLFGASNIVFVPMMRSIAKPDNEANKLKRMQTIAKEAAELSHRFDVPDIEFITSFKSIDWTKYHVILLADENEKTTTLSTAYPNVSSKDKIALIIGPEGGITEQERHYFTSLGAHSVSLGKLILPTELASIYALTYLSFKNH